MFQRKHPPIPPHLCIVTIVSRVQHTWGLQKDLRHGQAPFSQGLLPLHRQGHIPTLHLLPITSKGMLILLAQAVLMIR